MTLTPVRGTGTQYRAEFELKAPSDPGDRVCRVRIPVPAPSNRPPVEIMVSARIGTELAAIPSRVLLPAASREALTREFELVCLSPDQRRLDAAAVAWPPDEGVRWAAVPGRRPDRLKVTVTFAPAFLQRLAAGRPVPLAVGCPAAKPAVLLCLPRPTGSSP
jgi:hypothetical protein